MNTLVIINKITMKSIKELLEDNKCEECNGELGFVDYGWNIGNQYDGWAELSCIKCNRRRGRWSGKLLEEGEEEDVRERYKLYE